MTVSDQAAVSLAALDAWLSSDSACLAYPADQTAHQTADQVAHQVAQERDLLTGLAISALEPALGEIERLQSVPLRDDLQFAGPARLPEIRQLHAWLYAPAQRVACAVHTPQWQPPSALSPATSTQATSTRANWEALLREHFHARFHTGEGWTSVGVVAMPLRLPFDEPGLRIRPLLALWAPVSAGEHYLSDTMTTSVRHGAPHVTGVQVFSAALYIKALLAQGRSTVEIPAYSQGSSFLTIAREH